MTCVAIIPNGLFNDKCTARIQMCLVTAGGTLRNPHESLLHLEVRFPRDRGVFTYARLAHFDDALEIKTLF